MRQANRRKYHYVYRITRFDGKFYIGIHSTDDLDDGYFGSGKRLGYSVKKHGKSSHTKEILEFHPDREGVKLREAELVNEECLKDPLCMNLKLGGEGGWDHIDFSSGELRRRQSLGGAAANKIRTHYMVAKLKDPTFKQAWKDKISKGRLANPTDYTHSDEVKRKISESASNRTGELNSQYGTCWITRDSVNKKIRKELLDDFIQSGWSRGRYAA